MRFDFESETSMGTQRPGVRPERRRRGGEGGGRWTTPPAPSLDVDQIKVERRGARVPVSTSAGAPSAPLRRRRSRSSFLFCFCCFGLVVLLQIRQFSRSSSGIFPNRIRRFSIPIRGDLCAWPVSVTSKLKSGCRERHSVSFSLCFHEESRPSRARGNATEVIDCLV